MTPQHATLELNITGLDCPNCAEHLESIVKEIAGVTRVTTLLADRKAVVLFDPTTTTSVAIREIIKPAGYAIGAEGDEK